MTLEVAEFVQERALPIPLPRWTLWGLVIYALIYQFNLTLGLPVGLTFILLPLEWLADNLPGGQIDELLIAFTGVKAWRALQHGDFDVFEISTGLWAGFKKWIARWW